MTDTGHIDTAAPGSPPATPANIAKVQANLAAMQRFNDYVYNHSSALVNNAYLLMSEKDSDPGADAGLDILIAALRGLGSILGPIGTFASTLFGGLLQSWSTNLPPNLNTTFAQMFERLSKTAIQVDTNLADLATDPASQWSKSFTFEGQTATLSDLSVSDFPTETDPVFEQMATSALAKLDASIWATVLQKNYDIIKLSWPLNPSTSRPMPFYFAGPESAFPSAQADAEIKSNPAQNIVPAGWYPASGCADPDRWDYNIFVLGTGSGFSRRNLSSAACNYLFRNLYSDTVVNPDGLYLRETVFTGLKLKVSISADLTAPEPKLSRQYLRAMKQGKTLTALISREGREAVEARVIAKAQSDRLFAKELETMPRETLEAFLGVRIPETLRLNITVERGGSFGLVVPTEHLPVPSDNDDS